MKPHIDVKSLPEQMTRAQLSKLLDVTYQTIDRWIEKGRLAKGQKIFSNRIFTRNGAAEPAEPAAVLRAKRKLGRQKRGQ